jgi:hypothetical protein
MITTIPGFINNVSDDILKTTNNSCHFTDIASLVHNKSLIEPSLDCKNSFVNNLKYVFFIANAINGISSVALYTISISYIENIFSSKKAPICQAIYLVVGNLGIGIGMLAVSGLLNINASFIYGTNTKNSNSNSENANWIGAWWIIYLFITLANIILGLLVWSFSPKLQPKFIKKHITSEKKLPKFVVAKEYLTEFKTNGLNIISNPSFVFILLCTTTEALIVKGYSSYLSKYIEYQFRLPTTWSVMLTGTIGFVSLIIGPFIGALLIKKLSWDQKDCIKFIFVTLFVTSFLFLTFMIYCPQEKFIDTPSSKSYLTLNTSIQCNCEKNVYEPYCFNDKYIFQSACLAGCQQKNGSTYLKCAQLKILEKSADDLTLVSCSRPANQCKYLMILASLGGTCVLCLSSLVLIPILKVILSCVNEDNQSFALGIRSFVNKLFGNIPGPLIFAAVIDSSCVLWINGSCKSNRTCRLYDNKKFSLGLSLLGGCFRFVSAIFAFVTYLFIRRIESKSFKNISQVNDLHHKRDTPNKEIVLLKNLTKL